MSTTTALVTVSEFLRMPDPVTGHNELHHGEVVTIPPPKTEHERIQRRLRALLERAFGDRSVVGVEMAFQPAPEFEVWRADVGVLSKVREAATPGDEYLQGAPDLVVEVLSPGNTVFEINDKMHTCLEHGASSFWLVDPKRKAVTVTSSDLLTRHYRAQDQKIEAAPGVFIPINEIFEYRP